MIAELIRFRSDDAGTFGALVMPGKGALCTVERPWVPRDGTGKAWSYGLPGESCVPTGMYELKRDHSPRFDRLMWYLVGEGLSVRDMGRERVQQRSGIMFHAANKASELRGCIAPGKYYDPHSSAVRHSQVAMTELAAWLATLANPQLRIRNALQEN